MLIHREIHINNMIELVCVDAHVVVALSLQHQEEKVLSY
jgi:hypothetical protein